MKLQKGTSFDWNYATWTVLERNGRYVFLQGDQPGIQRFYATANVIVAGNDELCRPYLTGLTPDSYDRDKIYEHYQSEIERLRKQELVLAEQAELQNIKDRVRVAKIAKVNEANIMKKSAEASLKELIFDGDVKSLVKSRKLRSLISEINACETIISTLI